MSNLNFRKFCIMVAGGVAIQWLAPAPVHADVCTDPNCIYYQSFDQTPSGGTMSGSALQLNTGWSTDANDSSTAVKFTTTGRFGSALILDSASAPRGIWILAENLFGGTQLPSAGTISFWFKPTQSSTNDDWVSNGFVTRTHYFFNVRDPAGTGTNILGLRKFYAGSSGRSYLTLDAQSPTLLSTSIEDRSLLGPSNWTTNDDFHLIEIVWDTSHNYVGLIIDGSYIREGSLGSSATAAFSANTRFTLGNSGFGSWGDGYGGWVASGAIDELKVYNVAKYGYRNPVEYKSKAVDNGVREPWETPENSPADAMLKQAADTNADSATRYFFSTPAYQKVTESTLPDPSKSDQQIFSPLDSNDKLKVYIQPGEIQSVYINYYNRTTQIDSATISVTDFAHTDDPDDKIENPELFVVSNWFQSSDRLNLGGLPRYVPELLLTEETPALNGYSNAKASDNVTDALPDLPAPSQSVTAVKLPRNSTRQFMVRLTVPANAVPGRYLGSISIDAGSAGTLPIEVNVGNAPLAELDRDALVFHQQYFDEYQNGAFNCENRIPVTQSFYEAQLADLKNHGMNGEHAYGYGPDNADLIKLYGLDRTVVLANPWCVPTLIPQLVLDEKMNFGSLYFHTQDEIHLFPHRICWHINDATLFRPPAPISTTTNLEYANSLKTSQTYAADGGGTCTGSAPIDLVSIQADGEGKGSLPFLVGRAGSNPPALPASKNTYYWQLLSEDGRVNRFNAGYLLWMTGMDGIYPFGYMPEGTPDVFNDFTSRRDQAVYPSVDGPLQTLQWEALREGINDYRYLLTWENLLDAAQNSGDPVQQAAVQPSRIKQAAIRTRYMDAVITPIGQGCSGTSSCPDQSMFLRNVALAAFAEDRRTMQLEIENLNAIAQHGLTVSYFNDSDTNSSGVITAADTKLVAPAVLQRIEPNVNFNYGIGYGPGSGVNMDYFSARFTGRLIVPAYTGVYTFCLKGDDGIRLWVNDVDLLEDDYWRAMDSETGCGEVSLTAGQSVAIKVEFFDLLEDAIMELKWSWPGHAAEVVPSSSFYAQ